MNFQFYFGFRIFDFGIMLKAVMVEEQVYSGGNGKKLGN